MAVKYKNAKAVVTGTSTAQTILTPANATTAVIKSIIACEQSNNADTISLTITDTADTPVTFSLYKDKAITAKATAELLTAPLVVQENEILKVTAATANRLHVVASLLEVS